MVQWCRAGSNGRIGSNPILQLPFLLSSSILPLIFISLMELNKLESHLNNIPQEKWKALNDLLLEIEQTETFSISSGFQKKDKNTFILPRAIPAPVVLKFVDVVDKMQLAPEFEWITWKEAQLILENREGEIESLDAVSLCKLLTVMIRANTVADGFLLSCFSNDAVAMILKTLLNKYYKD